MVLSQSIKALVPGSFVVLPRWQGPKNVLKKGLQKRCDSSLDNCFNQIQGACVCTSFALALASPAKTFHLI